MARPPPKPPSTRERALGLLARREQSRVELQRKLTSRGVSREEAAQTVDALADSHLQSNDRFASMLVRRRIGDGYGPMRISAELASHGIDRDTIRAAIDEEAPDWLEIATRLHTRRYGGRPSTDIKERMKRASWLAQRGFPPDIARRVAALTE